MFQQLQDYLFRYKSVAIPGVGTFALTEQAATLDVANQLLLPPAYAIRFSTEAEVAAHQLQTLAAAYDNDAETAKLELVRFGAALQQQLQSAVFHWQGIGALRLANAQVQFEPHSQRTLLAAVPAHRVLRKQVTHTVLVGDQEMRYTAEAYEASLATQRKRDWFLIIGWIIAVLAFTFLAYHLYTGNFAPESSGLRRKPEMATQPQQYRE